MRFDRVTEWAPRHGVIYGLISYDSFGKNRYTDRQKDRQTAQILDGAIIIHVVRFGISKWPKVLRNAFFFHKCVSSHRYSRF